MALAVERAARILYVVAFSNGKPVPTFPENALWLASSSRALHFPSPQDSLMPADVKAQYAVRAAAGEIERDAAQERVLEMLAQLERRLREHRLARKSSSLGWLFGARERKEEPIRGLYVFGEVGRGKTMLMDLFCGASAVKRKRRAHFHEFMSDVHERVRELRHQIKLGEIKNGEDPIRLAAAA